MLREPEGFLGGYVGVPRDHPLWGWDHEAVPHELGIEVHRRADLLAHLRGWTDPARVLAVEQGRICHVRIQRPRGIPQAQAGGGGDGADDADNWWFGFQCNHLYDVVPSSASASTFMAAETRAPSAPMATWFARSSTSRASCARSPMAYRCRLASGRPCRASASIRIRPGPHGHGRQVLANCPGAGGCAPRLAGSRTRRAAPGVRSATGSGRVSSASPTSMSRRSSTSCCCAC
ncbi:hypothetical protein AB5I41_25260 [Sphingomonas sp. MMS24-JH45]